MNNFKTHSSAWKRLVKEVFGLTKHKEDILRICSDDGEEYHIIKYNKNVYEIVTPEQFIDRVTSGKKVMRIGATING